jgi:hypothetical protein
MIPGQWALWVTCGIAVAVAAIVAVKLSNQLTRTMGLAKWDFNQSWASNITIVSGVVSLGLLTTLKDTVIFQHSTYTYLALFFPLLVALAPILYNFTREVRLSNDKPPQVTIQGRAFTFLAAASLTVWGAAGQLIIQAALVFELFHASPSYIPLEPVVVAEVLFAVIFCALPVYAGLTMNAAIRIQSSPTSQLSLRAATDQAHTVGWTLL